MTLHNEDLTDLYLSRSNVWAVKSRPTMDWTYKCDVSGRESTRVFLSEFFRKTVSGKTKKVM
jgi:hypothetical protein